MKTAGNKLIILGAGVGLFMVFYLLIYYPKLQSLKVIDQDIKRKNLNLKEGNSLQRNLKSLQEEKAKLQKDSQNFRRSLPNQEGIRDFLKEVWETAEKNGVMIES